MPRHQAVAKSHARPHAGKYTNEAFKALDSALEVAPEHVPTLQAYARLAVRDGRRDDKVATMLKAIALRGETAGWREWAQEQTARGQ